MRHYEILANLCDKIESWGIDPITLAKAIGIFLILVILIGLMIAFPILLAILLTITICIGLIGLIYLMLE
jgi:hypothetical protein